MGATTTETRTRTRPAPPRFTKRQAAALYRKADTAGLKAAGKAKPTPMIVGTPTTPLGSDIDPTKRVYYVPGGVCGFAWVVIEPGTSSFARWLRKTGKGSPAYGGGTQVRVRGFGQSMETKEAYAHAFAEVLREAGIRAFAESRMD